MRALTFDGELGYTAEAPLPVPDAGDALIRVRMAGICSTDLEILKGYMGFHGIPGHEFVGVVESCEDSVWIGKRVVGEINCSCRICEACRSGRTRHCPARTVLGIAGRDGAFAEYLTLPLCNLHELPEEVTDAQGVFVEPLAAAFEILEQTKISSTDRVVVVGDGRLGLLTAQVLRKTGAPVTVIGHHQENLDIVRGFGIQALLEEESSGIKGADLVVDCSGSPAGFERSRKLVRPGGRLVLKSTFASDVPADLSSLVVDEVTLIGSRCGPFPPAISALTRGEVKVSPLISAVYSLEEGIAAFERASAAGVLKVLLGKL